MHIPKKLNILYLALLKMLSRRLIFMAQNPLQAHLLSLHFGDHINVSTVGMNAAEEFDNTHQSLPKPEDVSICYDIVYHGSSIAAKGILYLIELANIMEDINFLIPDQLSNIVDVLGCLPPPNVTCKNLSWENGLKEAVSSARLVINPSLWSAPIEGALVKSAKYNQNVATVESLYGYESEIKTITNHIRLPRDTIQASRILNDFFKTNHHQPR
jgi:hypothetical protein